MPRILDIKIALGNEQLILSSSLIHGQCLDTPQRRCVSDSAMSTHLPQEGGERKRAGPRRAAGVISVEQGLEERAQQGERGVCADDRRVGAAVAHGGRQSESDHLQPRRPTQACRQPDRHRNSDA